MNHPTVLSLILMSLVIVPLMVAVLGLITHLQMAKREIQALRRFILMQGLNLRAPLPMDRRRP